MKIRIGKFAAAYIRHPWLPVLVFLCLLATSVALTLLRSKTWAVPANVLTVAALVSFLGIPVAGILNLVRRQWKTALLHLLAIPLAVLAVAAAMCFMMFYSMFGPSDDGFADSLVIPPELAVADPLAEPEARPAPNNDAFQRVLLDALSGPGGEDSTITASLSSLVQLRQSHPDLLARYLRCSSAWRVFTEDGSLFATRRWIIGSKRQYTLHGYYTQHKLDMFNKSGIPEFQTRATLGLAGKPWWRGNADSTWLQAGDSAPVRLSTGNQMFESHCVISTGGLAVEIFEQSQAKERRLTKAALSHIEAELAPLAAQPTEEILRALLPTDSVRIGAPSLELRNSFQPGLYDAYVWINPGEPGLLYLKAFEVTKGIPLSVERLQESSNEWVGWSDNPEELFLSNTHFTIYEGDWGKPYAARFEVWFAPDAGAPERKLLEKIFKIEGWQR